MRASLLTCGALLSATLIAGTAVAQTPAPAATSDTAPAAAKDPNEKVCRNAPYTGTRLGAKKICKTRAEWDAATARTREMMDKMQTNTMSSN